jgi:hypothetical protein
MRLAIWLAFIVAVAGCARRQRTGTSYKRDSNPSQTAHRAEARHSAGSVPCRAEDITIANTNYGSRDFHTGGLWEWEATCRGKTYYCASHLPGSGWARGKTWSAAKCSVISEEEDDRIEPPPPAPKARTSTTGRQPFGSE